MTHDRILVTGGAGFINFHMVRRLFERLRHPFTMRELANKVMALVGGNAGVEYHPLPAGDPT